MSEAVDLRKGHVELSEGNRGGRDHLGLVEGVLRGPPSFGGVIFAQPRASVSETLSSVKYGQQCWCFVAKVNGSPLQQWISVLLINARLSLRPVRQQQ